MLKGDIGKKDNKKIQLKPNVELLYWEKKLKDKNK
jgi:hypothetical protein